MAQSTSMIERFQNQMEWNETEWKEFVAQFVKEVKAQREAARVITREDMENLLYCLGVNKKKEGYTFIVIALESMINEPKTYERGFTTKLYPELGRKYNMKPYKVAEAMQEVIDEAAMQKTLVFEEIFEKIMTERGKRPTNIQFIRNCMFYLEKKKVEKLL